MNKNQILLSQNAPQLGVYRVEPMTRGFSNFDNDYCHLGISMNQHYHQGRKLEALANWAKSRFKHVEFIIGDTLQSYNIKFQKNVDTDEAYELARQQGDEWIKAHAHHLEGCIVSRWQDYVSIDQVKLFKKLVFSKYETDPELQNDIRKTIKSYYLRLYKRKPELYCIQNFPSFYQHSKYFILEETAVFSYLEFLDKGPFIYPGRPTVNHIIKADGELIPFDRNLSITIVKNKVQKAA